MVALQIRDVPDELRDVLARDAREHGQSLQVYLREVIERQASVARNRAAVRHFEPIRGTGDRSSVDVAELIREQRREREEHLLRVVSGDVIRDVTGDLTGRAE